MRITGSSWLPSMTFVSLSSTDLPMDANLPFSNLTTDPTANALATKPNFHLLVLATEPNARLCKSLLSAAVLNYPPPTLINFNLTFYDKSWVAPTHIGNIHEVFDYLSNTKY